mmetsp:Transcript_43997/g.71549  ORF Transcript_43997/g.71549 Transcript_43997/m.71549 type:complete len:90 (-) Transcript_43997:1042-1311(-)
MGWAHGDKEWDAPEPFSEPVAGRLEDVTNGVCHVENGPQLEQWTGGSPACTGTDDISARCGAGLALSSHVGEMRVGQGLKNSTHLQHQH